MCVLQLLGGVAGSLLEGLLMPGVHVGHNKHVVPSGCFAVHGVGAVRLVLLEFVFTLLFLMVRSPGRSLDRFFISSPLEWTA